MKIRYALFMLILWMPAGVFGAFDEMAIGARPVGLGSAYVALADDSQSIYWNPAGLAGNQGQEIGSSYFRPFDMDGFDFTAIQVVSRTPWGSFGLSYIGHGDDLYSENSLQLSYGRSLTAAIDLGLTGRLMQLEIERYDNAQTFAADVGFLVRPIEKMQLGFFYRNLNAATIGESNEEIPQVLAVGAWFQLPQNINLLVDLHKDIEQPLQVRGGFEYRPIDLLAIRAGGHSEPDQFAAGFGVRGPGAVRFIHFDYGLQTHPTLGTTHHFSLTIKRQPAPATN